MTWVEPGTWAPLPLGEGSGEEGTRQRKKWDPPRSDDIGRHHRGGPGFTVILSWSMDHGKSVLRRLRSRSARDAAEYGALRHRRYDADPHGRSDFRVREDQQLRRDHSV